MSESNRSSQLIGDQELLGDFVAEAREHLATISDGLLEMESDAGDPEVVNSVFRSLHTIKGVSSFIGLDDINTLSHAGENVLDNVRQETLEPTREVIDTLLQTCDLLSSLVDDAANLDQIRDRSEPIEQLKKKLGEILAANSAPSKPAPSNPAPANPALAETEPATTDESLWPAPGAALSAELVGQFVTENTENLEELERGLLQLEKHPNHADSINAVFRAIHSIKGTADYVGLAQIKTLSHHLESVLQLARSEHLEITPYVSDLVLEGADALGSMINQLRPEGEVGRDLSDLVLRILAVANGPAGGSEQAVSVQPVVTTPSVNAQLEIFVQSASQHVQSIAEQSEKLLQPDCSEVALDTLRRSLSTLENAADYMQRDEFFDPCEQFLCLLDNLPEDADSPDEITAQRIGALKDELAELLQQACTEAESPSKNAATAADDAASAASREEGSVTTGPSRGPAGKAPAARTMRVDQEKLDDYINLAGELVIARNTLAHVFRQFHNGHEGNLRRLKAAIEGVDRISSTIQDNAMAMRMVPVNNVFQRFPRVVRDIAKAKGKNIDLQIFGEDTEIDKQVAEALGDPLVHLIRNSADHGIEMPQQRKAAGKSETGLITLKAGREGNFIVIDIIDDGAGIDVQRLKAKAVQDGLLTQEKADAMPREKALSLIFAAGLSTAKKVTDVSGRGVGMDVVRTNINHVGGSVLVMSEEGEGSQLRIQLPLTLAVTTALLVSAGEQTYAIPIDAVQETVKVPPQRVGRLKGHRAITLRGKIVALKSLARMLASDHQQNGKHDRLDRPPPLHVDQTGRVPIVVVDAGGTQFGFIVDKLLGQQEIVLKPLPGYLAQLPGLGSATVMGDGTIVLILDPNTLYTAALSQNEEPTNLETLDGQDSRH